MPLNCPKRSTRFALTRATAFAAVDNAIRVIERTRDEIAPVFDNGTCYYCVAAEGPCTGDNCTYSLCGHMSHECCAIRARDTAFRGVRDALSAFADGVNEPYTPSAVVHGIQCGFCRYQFTGHDDLIDMGALKRQFERARRPRNPPTVASCERFANEQLDDLAKVQKRYDLVKAMYSGTYTPTNPPPKPQSRW